MLRLISLSLLFLCLLLASEVFAQEVNSEFLWSASEDSTERVITGSSDETSGYWYSFENGRGFKIWKAFKSK